MIRFGVAGAILLAVLGACASAPGSQVPALNLEELEDPTFQLTEIVMLVNAQVDEERAGEKMMESQGEDLLKAAMTTARRSDVTLTTDSFSEAYESGQVQVQFTRDEVTRNFIIHRYEWLLESNATQEGRLTISIAPNEQGELPAFLRLSQARPETAEGRADHTIQFSLAVE